MSRRDESQWNDAAFMVRLERAAASTARKAAGFLLAESVKRAPIDTSELIDSLEARVLRDGDDFLAGVHVPANAGAKDYALKVHETQVIGDVQPGPGQMGLGPKSKRKQASSSVDVGGKYIERAINDNLERIERFLAREMARAMEEG